MAINETAFINHDVYNEGVAKYFKSNTSKKLLIGLLDNNGRLLAISGIRYSTRESDASPEEECSLVLGDFNGGTGTNFENKTLTLPTVHFDYTASVTGETSGNATYFCVIDATAASDKQWIDTRIEKSQIEVPTEVATSVTMTYNAEQGSAYFGSNAAAKVLMFGRLSNTPSIDASTNFYFSGATIKFTEAAN